MSQLEDYMRGVPLDPEIEALNVEPELPAPAAPAPERMTGKDAEWLTRLTLQPGWEVLQRLIDEEVNLMQLTAVELSLIDPVGNAAALQSAWLQVKALREMRGLIANLVRRATQKSSEDLT